ncbi:MAG: LPS export ABC transporter periplasmic protein LptC [Candidatus Kapaibacteriales bacterium]
MLVITLFLLLFVASCKKNEEIQKGTLFQQHFLELPDQIAKNIQVDFIDTSFLKARLWAKTAKVYYSRKETLLKDSIKVEFYSKSSQKIISILTADSAKIDDATKDMFAYGHIVVVSDSPKTLLKTTQLQWKNQAQKLYSSEYIEITRSEEEIRGYGFESDINLNNYKIFNVSGIKR